MTQFHGQNPKNSDEEWLPCPVPKYTVALKNGTDIQQSCPRNAEKNCDVEKICSRIAVCEWKCVDQCPDGKIGLVLSRRNLSSTEIAKLNSGNFWILYPNEFYSNLNS